MTYQRAQQLAVLYLIGALLLLGFVWNPLTGSTQAVENNNETLAATSERNAEQIKAYEEALEVVNTLNTLQQEQLSEAITPEYAQDDLIEDIVNLAEKNYIGVTSATFTKDQDSDLPPTLASPLTITMAAPNQRQFIMFLRSLENDNRIYRIRSMSIDYQSEVIETSLIIETYNY